jgi:hypothetical protein
VDFAYAVLRGDPPEVLVAQDVDVLHRVIALEIVAQTPASALSEEVGNKIRDALLNEEWGTAVELWMTYYSREPLDVYPSGLRVWTDAQVTADLTGIELQFRPLFKDRAGD